MVELITYAFLMKGCHIGDFQNSFQISKHLSDQTLTFPAFVPDFHFFSDKCNEFQIRFQVSPFSGTVSGRFVPGVTGECQSFVETRGS